MAEMNITSKLVLGFVMLLMGAVFVSVIATNGLVVTEKDGIVNEVITQTAGAPIWDGTKINASYVYTIAEAPTDWKVDDCPITSFSLSNSSGDLYTETTDYVFTASAGTYTIVDTVTTNQSGQTDNSTLVSYTYCSDDYMNLSWGRTIINLVAGFFAIALLLIAVGIFFSIAKDTGII